MDRFVLKFEKKRVDANKCDVTEPVSLSTGMLKYIVLFRQSFTLSRSPDNLASAPILYAYSQYVYIRRCVSYLPITLKLLC
jgi:hypothetical protein